jgi:hypothetical protein
MKWILILFIYFPVFSQITVEPITIFNSGNFKIHLIENPFAYEDQNNFRQVNGFLEYGPPFTQDVIPIDLNNDGNIDIINGTILSLNENLEQIEFGHITLPIYLQHLGNFRFSVYMNPDYSNNSLLHNVDDFEIYDFDNDGQNEILLGGEHLHVMNVGEEMFQKTNAWLQTNTSYETTLMTWGDNVTESKYNRYYNIENGYLVDKVKEFGNNNQFVFDRERLVSNHSQGIFDINGDGLNDVIYNTQGESGSFFDIYTNNNNGNFTYQRVTADRTFPNGKLIPYDFNGDGYPGFFAAGPNENGDWYLYKYQNTNGTIDFSNPKEIDLIKSLNTNFPNWATQATLRNYFINDIDNDGNDELVTFFTNQYSGLGNYSNDVQNLVSLQPHNLINIYKIGSTISNVTTQYFENISDYESFKNWFSKSSNLIFKDINYDGHIDMVPYQTRHPNELWNSSDDFQYFKYDSSLNKFKFQSHDGLKSILSNTNLVNNDIGNLEVFQFDYIDLNNNGKFEMIESSVNYNGKNYMMIIEGSFVEENYLLSSYLKDKLLNVFPNPTNNILKIDFNDYKSSELFSIDGKSVLKSTAKQIDLSKEVKGIYFLVIEDINGMKSNRIKVIKQ